MEIQETARNTRGLTDLLRRRRDPSGDLPFDPDAEPPMEDGEERSADAVHPRRLPGR